MLDKGHAAVGRHMSADTLAEGGADRGGVLRPGQPEADLGTRFCRQHRLETFAGVTAGDAVDLECRAIPDHLQPAAPALANRLVQPDPRQEGRRIEAERVPVGTERTGQFRDAIVEAGQRDTASGILDGRQRVDQHLDRVRGKAAETAGMKVAIGAADGDLLPHQPAKLRGDGGPPVGVKAGVADHREVARQLVRILAQEGVKRGRAGFLLALEQQREIGGQGTMHVPPGAERLDECHQLALVVAGAARADDRPLGRILDDRLERWPVPEGQGIDRLHVIMAIEQNPAPPAGG